MNTQEKNTLKRETQRRNLWLQFVNGLCSLTQSWIKALVTLVYGLLAWFIWVCRDDVFHFDNYEMLNRSNFSQLILVLLAIGFVWLIIMFGTPYGSKRINDNLWRVGIINHAGESPTLIKKSKDKQNLNIEILEFETCGIPKSEFENQQSKIEAALNIHIVKVEQGKNMQRVILHTVSGNCDLPKVIHWKDEYLSDKNFELILGKSFLGMETVNLAKIPHILLGGSTGSGKSVLLKLLVMQCVKKGAIVYVACFKCGVDFPPIWHKQCTIITEETALLELLTDLEAELESRKEILRLSYYSNIDELNKNAETKLPRLIFACDEIAELFDKTALSKERKELVTQIEAKISKIARQGRALGIHLILATQRPDARILEGQIRSNLDFRVCGRADNILSQIILDNGDAADKIPKHAQGRFLTHNGTVFQAYWFDETAVFL